MCNCKYKAISLTVVFFWCALLLQAQQVYQEKHRPQIHFSPKKNWMNDPNGMVYHNGTYHLFFQHYPDKPVWGPMHWGHATSTDLIHWEEQPIALYPDSLGYIFSGSAVVDINNTTGFGKNGQIPLVAVFTQHDPERAKRKTGDHETQSLAYSLDNGKTWTKYSGNPVLKNPGIPDFRDPKVFWYEPQKKWIMTLAAKDRISFYSSPDLKVWTKESDFGEQAGAHGGVWECPDLFPLKDNGRDVWVLIVNLNPGGPNKGSATQYFLGDFDGHTFSALSTETKWLDYGPDEYAGITWSNTGDRKIFIGWMSNWDYANVVPTETWRSATTIARELKLVHAGEELRVAAFPVDELKKIQSAGVNFEGLSVSGRKNMSFALPGNKLPCRINIELEDIRDFSVAFSNSKGEELVVGYDKATNEYYADRTRSGVTDFHSNFPDRHVAPRFSASSSLKMTLVVDVSSVELFADNGLTVLTQIFFPNETYNKIELVSTEPTTVSLIQFMKLRGIWEK